jgi:hypothetical protein
MLIEKEDLFSTSITNLINSFKPNGKYMYHLL